MGRSFTIRPVNGAIESDHPDARRLTSDERISGNGFTPWQLSYSVHTVFSFSPHLVSLPQ